jgi:hypothetical protein
MRTIGTRCAARECHISTCLYTTRVVHTRCAARECHISTCLYTTRVVRTCCAARECHISTCLYTTRVVSQRILRVPKARASEDQFLNLQVFLWLCNWRYHRRGLWAIVYSKHCSLFKEGILSYLDCNNSRFYRHFAVEKITCNIDPQAALAQSLSLALLWAGFIIYRCERVHWMPLDHNQLITESRTLSQGAYKYHLMFASHCTTKRQIALSTFGGRK